MVISKIDKTKALVAYLSKECEGRPAHLGITKLNKILYFIDFGHIATQGYSITGMNYLKREHGPVPADLQTYLDVFEGEGCINVVRCENEFGGTSTEIRPMRGFPKVDLARYFNEAELDTITKTVKALKGRYAKRVSKISHTHYTWISTTLNQNIDPENAKHCAFDWLGFYGEGKTKEDFEEARAMRIAIDEDPELSAEFDEICSSKIKFFARPR